MPQGVKSNLTPAEKYELHLQRCASYKKKRLETDPEFRKKCKEYNTEYFRKLREAGQAERASKQNIV